MKSYNLLGDPSLYFGGLGCIADYEFENDEVFHSGDEITYQASNSITTSVDGATFHVENGANVTLLAGNSIKFQPGFKVEAGATFYAGIASCSSTKKSLQINNSDLKEDVQFTNTKSNIELAPEKMFSVYPNPVSDLLTIEYKANNEKLISIEIFSISGTLVEKYNPQQNAKNSHYHISMNMKAYQNGVYIYKVFTETQTYTGKIIKSH